MLIPRYFVEVGVLDVAYPLFSDLPDAWPGVSRSDFGPLDFESGLLASGLLACRSFIDVSIYDLAAKDAWGQEGIVDTHLLWLLLFLFFLRLVDSLVLFPVTSLAIRHTCRKNPRCSHFVDVAASRGSAWFSVPRRSRNCHLLNG